MIGKKHGNGLYVYGVNIETVRHEQNKQSENER